MLKRPQLNQRRGNFYFECGGAVLRMYSVAAKFALCNGLLTW